MELRSNHDGIFITDQLELGQKQTQECTEEYCIIIDTFTESKAAA